jgi:hypothetical protein
MAPCWPYCHPSASTVPLLHRPRSGEQRQQTGLANSRPARSDPTIFAARRDIERDAHQRHRFTIAQTDVAHQSGNQLRDWVSPESLRQLDLPEFTGHLAVASSLIHATPGNPVLICFKFFCSSSRLICALTRNISFCRSLSGLHRFGRELGYTWPQRKPFAGITFLRRGIQHQTRTSVPNAPLCPPPSSERKKVR